MIRQEQIKEEFEKCKEPIDFADRYPMLKLNYRIKSVDEVKDVLENIEQINLLGALYIYELKEKRIGDEYIKESLLRNMEIVKKNVNMNTKKTVAYMQVVVIYMMNFSLEECNKFAQDIFSEKIEKLKENCDTDEKFVSVVNHYSKLLLAAFKWLNKKIDWKPHYIKIMTSIYNVHKCGKQWFRPIEVAFRKQNWGYIFDDAEAKNYFELLCQTGNYDCGRFFLDNFDDSRNILGIEPQELVNYCYSMPSSDLISYARWYYEQKISSEYPIEVWCDDVLKLNSDPDTIKWIKITNYLNNICNAVLNSDYDEYDKLLDQADTYEMFEYTKQTYVKKIVKRLAVIINKLLKGRERSAYDFLIRIQHININEFSLIGTQNGWNTHPEIAETFSYDNIMDRLFLDYPPKEIVYIYMNSHLKENINIEDLVLRIADVTGKSYVNYYFKNYPLTGKVTMSNRPTAVRDKFFITPLQVKTEVSYDDYMSVCEAYHYNSDEARRFKKRLIRNQQRWYSRSLSEAELIADGDECMFFIQECDVKTGAIYARDVSLMDEVNEKRIYMRNTEFPQQIANWLDNIQLSGKFVEWNKDIPVWSTAFIRDIDENDKDGGARKRVDIALKILDTVIGLKDNQQELEKFIYAITNPMLEQINDFKYVPTRKRLYFEAGNDFSRLITEMRVKFKTILEDENIPPSIRKDIFLNTCASKFYEFKYVCQYIGKEFYIDTAEPPFVVYMVYIGENDGAHCFSTRGRASVLCSNADFKYFGNDKELNFGDLYAVELKNYDEENGWFVLNRVDLQKNEISVWEQYIRKISVDIKKATTAEEMVELKREIEEWNVIPRTEHQMNQFTHELNLLFIKRRFNIGECLNIIDILGKQNPYMNLEIDFSRFVADFKACYTESFERFISDYWQNSRSDTMFCDLFFKSFLRVFVSSEDFFNQLSSDENSVLMLKEYCKNKGYIK